MDSITGRDNIIIAQALCVAIEAMSREEYPEESNINDMRRILEARYPSAAAQFAAQRDLKTAVRLGFRPKEGEEIFKAARNFIAERTDVVDLYRQRGD
jgi:hypothetical protein